MQVNKVSNNAGYNSYAAKVYQQQLEQVHFQQIIDHRQKIKEDEKHIESSRLNQYNEEQRIDRNQRIFKQFHDMELYLFKCRQLQLHKIKNIHLGTNIDICV